MSKVAKFGFAARAGLLISGLLLGATGAEAGVFPNGVNLQPSYYNGGNVDFGWSLMRQQSKIGTVRIEIEPDHVAQAANWIAQANEQGYNVIATYHKYQVLGSDSNLELQAAAKWWRSNYATLAQGGPFTINLINEWGSHNITANAYAADYNQAIATIRAVYKGQIILDIPGYGQETGTAADAVKGTHGTRITDGRIILSAHIYPGAYNVEHNRWLARADLDELQSAGVPVIIGEFGSRTTGDADWSDLVDYAKSKDWTVLAWSWNGDGGEMNMVSPSWATDATATSFVTSEYFPEVYDKL